MASESPDALQMWGGIECTVNRVGERFYSQLAATGHADRIADLDAIAALGIRTLRYPILWELIDRAAPEGGWAWADRRLGRLRELGIAPIVGLVHHGSGPRDTNLLDEAFAPRLAAYAGQVANRYPWIEAYTPVNEPLTTARFSALYGLWYPHARDARSFVCALLNQCRAVALAMRAIRRVNSAARLVQTEDLGKTFSTPALQYQADFENERRWLSWDLLCGRVDARHPLWKFLIGTGICARDILWFADNPCPPQLIGVNYYATSERLLDERTDAFPAHCRGGNGRSLYADVEAVRWLEGHRISIQPRLEEAWERYRIPIAITEAHLGCTREEQMRWLYEVWTAAERSRAAGIEVRAVTSWALFGGYDWNSLLTRFTGCYESGAFDVRGGLPRETGVARLVRDLATGHEPAHKDLLRLPGWWHGPHSATPPRALNPERGETGRRRPARCSVPPLLIVGATGTLGRAFARLCQTRHIPVVLTSRQGLDIGQTSSIVKALESTSPWAVINTAGYVRVDDAESQPAQCFRENAYGVQELARVCAERRLPLVTFSSDLVFDGLQSKPYVETDRVAPLNVYGRSKAAAEAAVRDVFPDALVVRTSAFFGPWDDYNFLATALAGLAQGVVVPVANDEVVSPTYVPDLVNACLDLLFDRASGLWHLTNQGSVSWADFLRDAASRRGISSHSLRARPATELGRPAIRPRFSAMTSVRGLLLPPLDEAIHRFLRESDSTPLAA